MSTSPERARLVRRWMRRAARLGHLSVGSIYVLVGALALAASIDTHRQPTDSLGVFHHLLVGRTGRVVAIALVGGLIADAIWQAMRAFIGSGRGFGALVQRASWLGSGILHLGLAIAAIRLVDGALDGDADTAVQRWSSWVLSAPSGDWALGATALVVLSFALAMVYRAWSGEPDDSVEPAAMSEFARRLTFALARIGLAARAVTCAVAAAFLLLAALQHDPAEARGLAGTFRSVRTDLYGHAILALLAVGFIANGIVELVRARYRRRRIG